MRLVNESEVTQSFLQFMVSSYKIDVVTEKLLSLFKDVFDYGGYTVLILNEETDQFDFSYVHNLSRKDLDEIVNLIEEGVIDWTIKRGNPIFTPLQIDVSQLDSTPQRNLLILPLVVEDRGIGAVIALCSLEEKSLTKKSLELLVFLASQLALVVENSRLHSALEHRKKESSLLFRSSQIINSSLGLNEILKLVLQITLSEVKSEYGVFLLVDKKTGKLIPQESSGVPLSELRKGSLILGKGALGWTAKNGKPLIIDDYANDVRFRGSGEFVSLSPRTLLVAPLKITQETLGVLAVCNVVDSPFYTNSDLNTILILANYAATAIKNRSLHEDLQLSFVDTIKALANAIDAKDRYTRGHSQRVTQNSLRIAKFLGLSRKEMNMIRFCGLLHDIGKIGISDRILSKPSKLTEQEYESIKKHPTAGENMIKHIRFLQPGLGIIRHHHERYDGRGYPDGLKGKNIPLLARIVGLIDSFDTMTSDRPYRKALSVREAVKELKKGAGTQFDPQVVEAFLEVLGKDS